MVFSSPIFLFMFLPVVLAFCALPGLRLRNALLLVFSIIFYAWGEVLFVFLLVGCSLANYFLGLWVEREDEPRRRKWAVGVAIRHQSGIVFAGIRRVETGRVAVTGSRGAKRSWETRKRGGHRGPTCAHRHHHL